MDGEISPLCNVMKRDLSSDHKETFRADVHRIKALKPQQNY